MKIKTKIEKQNLSNTLIWNFVEVSKIIIKPIKIETYTHFFNSIIKHHLSRN
jgi:hypothetical protein